MSMQQPPITQRDYKTRPPRQRPAVRTWLPFAGGLGIGLLLAVVVFIKEHKPTPAPATTPVASVPTPMPPARKSNKPVATPAVGTAPASDTGAEFDFYNRLQNYEVVLPERDKEVRRQQPTTKITEPGTYVLQVGSYREEADALLHRDRYIKQGYPATVQRVSVDAEVWHRVRIGPFTDLNRLNSLREQLYRASVSAMVVRVVD